RRYRSSAGRSCSALRTHFSSPLNIMLKNIKNTIAKLDSRIDGMRKMAEIWRGERDSNPRYGYPHTDLAIQNTRPGTAPENAGKPLFSAAFRQRRWAQTAKVRANCGAIRGAIVNGGAR